MKYEESITHETYLITNKLTNSSLYNWFDEITEQGALVDETGPPTHVANSYQKR